MFGLFSNEPYQPLDHLTRKWYEHGFLWLNQEFSIEDHKARQIYLPTDNDFPFNWDQSEDCAYKVMQIIARELLIDPNELQIDFFTTGIQELSSPELIFLENDKDEPVPAGLYFEKNEQGKYVIALDRKLLLKPDELVATISHELCHVKLLGEKRIDVNDEHLTDLATVIFGFGVFNANSSFNFYTDHDRWGYQSAGYMKAPEWAYALALSAFFRYEDNPEWKNYLNSSIKKDFERALKYMIENEAEIFKFDDDEYE